MTADHPHLPCRMTNQLFPATILACRTYLLCFSGHSDFQRDLQLSGTLQHCRALPQPCDREQLPTYSCYAPSTPVFLKLGRPKPAILSHMWVITTCSRPLLFGFFFLVNEYDMVNMIQPEEGIKHLCAQI